MTPGTRGQCLGKFMVVTPVGGEGVASSGQRPGMLLSVLQSTGQSPHRIHEAPNVSRSKVKKPCFPFPFYILVNCFSILDSSHNQLPQQFLENF